MHWLRANASSNERRHENILRDCRGVLEASVNSTLRQRIARRQLGGWGHPGCDDKVRMLEDVTMVDPMQVLLSNGYCQ
jgi:hypothetical protein